MTTMDKAAIGWSIGIVAVGVLFAVYGQSIQDTDTPVTSNIPTTPSQPIVPTTPSQPDPDPMMKDPDPMMMKDNKMDGLVQIVEGQLVIGCEQALSVDKAELLTLIEENVMSSNDPELMQVIIGSGLLDTEGIAEDIILNCEAAQRLENQVNDQMPTGQDTMSQPQTINVEIPVGTSVTGCEQTNECYIDPLVTINVGDTVIWNNVDTAAHTVTSGSPTTGPDGKFDSSLLPSQSAFTHTFEEAGTFDYYCIVHPWMVGTVQVN